MLTFRSCSFCGKVKEKNIGTTLIRINLSYINVKLISFTCWIMSSLVLPCWREVSSSPQGHLPHCYGPCLSIRPYLDRRDVPTPPPITICLVSAAVMWPLALTQWLASCEPNLWTWVQSLVPPC